jgi:hypothetical protein
MIGKLKHRCGAQFTGKVGFIGREEVEKGLCEQEGGTGRPRRGWREERVADGEVQAIELTAGESVGDLQ